MKSSSTKTPCPCCGRVKGAYCRWDDSRIFCYQGQSCHPPKNLKKGDTIVFSNNVKYFFAGYDKGFSGNSALFCLHDPKNDRFNRPVTAESRRRMVADDIAELDKFRADLENAQFQISQALFTPDYDYLTPDQIREWMQIINGAFCKMLELKPRLMRLRRLDSSLDQVFRSLVEQLKELAYQKKDFESFWFNFLCDPGGGKGKRMSELLGDLTAKAKLKEEFDW